MLYDADFFNGWSLRPTGGLPLRVIASAAKQSRHEVLENSRLDCFVVPPRNDAKRLFFGDFLPGLLRRASSQ